MANSILSVRMDENVKKEFDDFCAKVGINASVAINMFARVVINEQRIPFEISANSDPFYNESNQRYLKKAIADIEAGKGVEHKLIEVTDD